MKSLNESINRRINVNQEKDKIYVEFNKKDIAHMIGYIECAEAYIKQNHMENDDKLLSDLKKQLKHFYLG